MEFIYEYKPIPVTINNIERIVTVEINDWEKEHKQMISNLLKHSKNHRFPINVLDGVDVEIFKSRNQLKNVRNNKKKIIKDVKNEFQQGITMNCLKNKIHKHINAQ